MQRVAILVRIAGHDHGGGITRAVSNGMVRGVVSKGREVVEVIDCAEFVLPHPRIIKEMEAQHVCQWNHTEYRAKEVRALGHCNGDQESRVRTSENGQSFGHGSSCRDEPLRG